MMHPHETIKIYSVSTVEVALLEIIENFKATFEADVDVHFHTTPQLKRKNLVLEDVDMVITTQTLVHQLLEHGELIKNSVVYLGQSKVALCTYKSSPTEEVFTVDDFFKLMIRCDEILFTEGSSGLYVETLFQDLNLKSLLESKYKRFSKGSDMLIYLSQFSKTAHPSPWIVGLGANTEILQFENMGVKLLCDLPDKLKHTTAYSIGRTSKTQHSDLANQFMDHLHLQHNWDLFKKSGLQ